MNMVEEDEEVEVYEIDIGELTKLHTATFTLNTNIGPIVLKALSRNKAAKVAEYLMRMNPGYNDLVVEWSFLKDIMAYPERLNEEQSDRFAEVTRLLSDWSDWFGIECFVKPELKHPDELDALSCLLDKSNFEQLNEMLKVLANPMPPNEANRRIGEVCVRYDVPMGDGITADNITVQQTAVIDEAVAAENERALAAHVEAMKLG